MIRVCFSGRESPRCLNGLAFIDLSRPLATMVRPISKGNRVVKYKFVNWLMEVSSRLPEGLKRGGADCAWFPETVAIVSWATQNYRYLGLACVADTEWFRVKGGGDFDMHVSDRVDQNIMRVENKCRGSGQAQRTGRKQE